MRLAKTSLRTRPKGIEKRRKLERGKEELPEIAKEDLERGSIM